MHISIYTAIQKTAPAGPLLFFCNIFGVDLTGESRTFEHTDFSERISVVNACIVARDKMRIGADLNGDNLRIGPICRSVITVGLRLGLGLGLGLGIVVYTNCWRK